jgi:hypothetical protein
MNGQRRLRANGSLLDGEFVGLVSLGPDLQIVVRQHITITLERRLAGRPHDSDRLARDTLNDLSRTFGISLTIPARTTIAPDEIATFVKLDCVLLGLWIGGVADEGDPLINFQHGGIQRGRSANVEIEDLGPRLVPNQQKVFKTLGDEQGVFVTLALKKCIRGHGGR